MESGVFIDSKGATKQSEDDTSVEELIDLVDDKPNGAGKSHIEQLMQKVDELIQKHRADLSLCLTNWLKSEWGVLVHTASSDGNGTPSLPKQREGTTSRKFAEQPIRSNTADSHAYSAAEGHSVTTTPHTVADCTPTSHEKQSNLSSHNSRVKIPAPIQGGHQFTDVLCRSSISKMEKALNTPNLIDEVGEKRKKRKLKQNWTDLVIEETRAVVKSQRSLLQRVTDSHFYEVFSATLIMANALFIGWQTQVAGREIRDQKQSETPADLIISIVFTVIFTIELGLRWIADGCCTFFQSDDLPWNLMDIFIVGLAIVDCMLEALNARSTMTNNIAVLRVLRILRVVKIARIVRIKRFFKELRIMVYSILGSCKSLLWVLLVVWFMLYMFGIAFTWAAINHLRKLDLADIPEDLEDHFGTLDSSLLSLFMAMSGGNDWAVYYDALAPLGSFFRYAFLLYISFALFAVVNIVTGVFVDSALQNNTRDRELLIQEEIQNKKDYLENMAAIFEEIDADNTGYISQEEFEVSLQDERVKAYFNSMKLDVSDARTLFALLDYDQSTEVEIKEFIAGCYKLQGESRSLDVKIMQYEVRYLSELILDIQHFLMPNKEEDSGGETLDKLGTSSGSH